MALYWGLNHKDPEQTENKSKIKKEGGAGVEAGGAGRSKQLKQHTMYDNCQLDAEKGIG